ncbi:hypothetical protein M9H77_31450 [Catharanthus roseus]|uniref:Uncharacterized protein n=1 Tax=Catharanthus roseus TaxID=4058 RepID=A0ACC0A4D1_CATRO|nr:hypothetical protein M9H77_31450 [Catharanthus roseus]
MRVSSVAGKSERIKTHQYSFYTPNLKHIIGIKFRHLIVTTSQTPYERSITNKHSWGTYQSTKNPHPPVITCLCKFHNYANARPIFMHVETCNFSGPKHSPAYANFTNMPCLHSCMSNHIIFQK